MARGTSCLGLSQEPPGGWGLGAGGWGLGAGGWGLGMGVGLVSAERAVVGLVRVDELRVMHRAGRVEVELEARHREGELCEDE